MIGVHPIKSYLFNNNIKVNVFFKIGVNSKMNLPYQFHKEAFAQTIPFFNNIFISNVSFKTMQAFRKGGHSRPISSILAHEMIHVLYEDRYGWRKTRLHNWLDTSEKSKYGFIWKEEGYAEYIAGGKGINFVEGLKILDGRGNTTYNSIAVEYFKYWLAIKYLLEIKHLSMDQVVYTKLDFDTVLQQAVLAFNQLQNMKRNLY